MAPWVVSRARVQRTHGRRGTEGSNPAPSSAESAANFVFGREAWKGPRRRQGTIPTVSTSNGTDGSNPVPSSGEMVDSDLDLFSALIARARFQARVVAERSIFIESMIIYELRAR